MNYDAEKIVPYEDDNASKGQQIERMFDEIAPQYDLLNRMMSLGLDKSWRKKGILSLKELAPQTILDIATGTGDLAILAHDLLKPQAILGVDISNEMMKVGERKVAAKGLSDKIRFDWQDSTDLQLVSDSFDAAMVAFGIRNFENLDKGLQSILRVLRPGGQLMILELSTPEHFPMKQAYYIYSRFIIPLLGRLISQSRKAYTYLPQSISAFPQNKAMKEILEKNGFQKASYKVLFPGVCSLYLAEKGKESQ